MRKFFGFLTNRITVTVVLLALQYAVYIVATRAFESVAESKVLLTIRIVFQVLAFCALIHLVNRDMIANGKLPWIILLMLFPMTGFFLYVMFSQNRIPYWQKPFFVHAYVETSKFCPLDERHLRALKFMGEHAGQAKFLAEVTSLPATCDTKTTYFASGEDWWKDLLVELEKAQKFIFMEYFIVQEGKMWNSVLEILERKAKSGVEVRFMYDDVGCVGKLKSNYFKKLRKMGIDCVKFGKLTPLFTAAHNNRDHRKITVVDGVVGYMGGLNLADEYINEVVRFGYWKDTAVKLEGPGVRNVTALFLQLFDAQSKRKENFAPYFDVETPHFENEGCVLPFGDGPKPIYDDHVAEKTFLNVINDAKKYVYVTTPYLIIDDALRDALQNAAARGVDVKIFTPQIPDKKLVFKITRYNYVALMKSGVKIYEFTKGFVHAKSLIADDAVGVVGTINFDYRSLLHHYECGVWMYKTKALTSLKRDLDELEKDCELQTSCKLGKFTVFLCKIATIFTPLL